MMEYYELRYSAFDLLSSLVMHH